MVKLIRGIKFSIALTIGVIFSMSVAGLCSLYIYYGGGNFLFFIFFCLDIIVAVYQFKTLFKQIKYFRGIKVYEKYMKEKCPILVEQINKLEQDGKTEEAENKRQELQTTFDNMSKELKKYF